MEKPIVGDGATVTLWTDSYACTVIKATEARVTLRRDKAVRVDPNGMSECQDYTYEQDPNGQTYTATRRRLKDGSYIWKLVGQKTTEVGGRVRFGVRREYYDFSF